MPATNSASASGVGKKTPAPKKITTNPTKKAMAVVAAESKASDTTSTPKIPQEEIANCWCDRVLVQRLAKAGFYYLNCPIRAFNPETKSFDGGCNCYFRSEDILDGSIVVCDVCRRYHKASDDKCKNCARIAWEARPEVAEQKKFLRTCYCDRDLSVYYTRNKNPNFYYYKCGEQKKGPDGKWIPACNFWARCDTYESLPKCEHCGKVICSYKCTQCSGGASAAAN